LTAKQKKEVYIACLADRSATAISRRWRDKLGSYPNNAGMHAFLQSVRYALNQTCSGLGWFFERYGFIH